MSFAAFLFSFQNLLQTCLWIFLANKNVDLLTSNIEKTVLRQYLYKVFPLRKVLAFCDNSLLKNPSKLIMSWTVQPVSQPQWIIKLLQKEPPSSA